MKISIIGAGYVGVVLSAVLAKVGYGVYCYDIDKKKIDILKNSKSPFYEPHLEEIINEVVGSGKLTPSTDIKEILENTDIVFFAVGTPSNEAGELDMKYMYSAIEESAKLITKDSIFVIRSTVPLGASKEIDIMINNQTDYSVDIVSLPEFLSEGSALYDSFIQERIVIGSSSSKATENVLSIFRDVDKFTNENSEYINSLSKNFYNKDSSSLELKNFDDRVFKMSNDEAELVKLSSNAFLATKISFANAISNICDKLDLNSNNVLDGIGSDKRIGRSFLSAGLGWGGGCFPKDTRGLIKIAEENDLDFQMLKASIYHNDFQVELAFRKIKEILSNSNGKVVSFLGLSFKPGTDDIRVSQSIELLKRLVELDINIKAYDVEANEIARKTLNYTNLEICNSMEEAIDKSDLIVIATEWKEFIEFDYKKAKELIKTPHIFDARNVLNPKMIREIGFVYFSLGNS